MRRRVTRNLCSAALQARPWRSVAVLCRWYPYRYQVEDGRTRIWSRRLDALYTDGVIETRRRGEFFGQERLKYLMRRKGTTAEGLPPLILDRVLGFSNGTLTDDIGVLAILFDQSGRPPLH